MIPILTALLPLAAPLLRKLIGGAEDALGAGKGKSKMAAVLTAFKAYQDELHKEDKIPGVIQDDNILSILIEFVLNSMKQDGSMVETKKEVPVVAPKPQNQAGTWSFTVAAGTKITVDEGGK
jgi:hypothetical protein